jgi:hypothetical protein
MRYTVICRIMGCEVQEEKFDNLGEAKKVATSATHIIDWVENTVLLPTIYENMWYGQWHRPKAKVEARFLEAATADGLNPNTYDWIKIRRRVEDALRKSNDHSKLLRIALELGVKLTP